MGWGKVWGSQGGVKWVADDVKGSGLFCVLPMA